MQEWSSLPSSWAPWRSPDPDQKFRQLLSQFCQADCKQIFKHLVYLRRLIDCCFVITNPNLITPTLACHYVCLHLPRLAVTHGPLHNTLHDEVNQSSNTGQHKKYANDANKVNPPVWNKTYIIKFPISIQTQKLSIFFSPNFSSLFVLYTRDTILYRILIIFTKWRNIFEYTIYLILLWSPPGCLSFSTSKSQHTCNCPECGVGHGELDAELIKNLKNWIFAEWLLLFTRLVSSARGGVRCSAVRTVPRYTRLVL